MRGLRIAVWEWPGEDPPILFAHATGFHARCWDQVIANLPGRRCIASDFQGHGRSEKTNPFSSWRPFGEVLADLANVLELKNAVGVGHSMGGHSVVLAAARYATTFESLVLLDPVIMPVEDYSGAAEPLDFVLKRKNAWDSAGQMFARFESKPPFSRWDRAVLRDYCDHALEPDGSLACSPVVEASIYAHSGAADSNIYAELPRVKARTLVVRSRDRYTYGQFDASPTAPDLADKLPHATDLQCKDLSHFMPMEAPARVARLILKHS